MQEFDFRVLLLAQRYDPVVVEADLLGEGCDCVQDRRQGGLKRFRDGWSDFVSEAVSRTRGQTRAGTLDHAACVVDEQGAGAHQGIA